MFLLGYFVVVLAGVCALAEGKASLAIGLTGAAMMILGVVETFGRPRR